MASLNNQRNWLNLLSEISEFPKHSGASGDFGAAKASQRFRSFQCIPEISKPSNLSEPWGFSELSGTSVCTAKHKSHEPIREIFSFGERDSFLLLCLECLVRAHSGIYSAREAPETAERMGEAPGCGLYPAARGKRLPAARTV